MPRLIRSKNPDHMEVANAWNIEGTYFENCICESVCPCIATSLSAPATQDRCQVVAVDHVDQESIEAVDVSGLKVQFRGSFLRLLQLWINLCRWPWPSLDGGEVGLG